ncbi:hypothetical protein NDU88_002737, partial [Pleurodeles waltl]
MKTLLRETPNAKVAPDAQRGEGSPKSHSMSTVERAQLSLSTAEADISLAGNLDINLPVTDGLVPSCGAGEL